VQIQEALALHHIRNNPEDFEARYNLAALLQMKGEVPGASLQVSEAVRIRADDATANNALGAVLLASGRIAEAIPHLHKALNGRPDYFDSLYNLENALAAQGDFLGALTHFPRGGTLEFTGCERRGQSGKRAGGDPA